MVPPLRQGLKIDFAHQAFLWQSEAKGKAHVHTVIIGFGLGDAPLKRIFVYDDIKGEPVGNVVQNINPYLLPGGDVTIQNRSRPICKVPAIGIGNKPIDGGFYLFEDEESFVASEPG